MTILIEFVTFILADGEIEDSTKNYALGILMIIIHNYYNGNDSILDICVQLVQSHVTVCQNSIRDVSLEAEEDRELVEYMNDCKKESAVCFSLVFH